MSMNIYRFIIEDGKYLPVIDGVDGTDYCGNYHQWMDVQYRMRFTTYTGMRLRRAFYRPYITLDEMLENIDRCKIEWSQSMVSSVDKDSTLEVSVKLTQKSPFSRVLHIEGLTYLIPDCMDINPSGKDELEMRSGVSYAVVSTVEELIREFERSVALIDELRELRWMGSKKSVSAILCAGDARW